MSLALHIGSASLSNRVGTLPTQLRYVAPITSSKKFEDENMILSNTLEKTKNLEVSNELVATPKVKLWTPLLR